MRLLLDTHALLWFLADDPRLSRHADAATKAPDTGVLVSVVSLWEITIKAGLGKLTVDEPFEETIAGRLADERINVLPVEIRHLAALRPLPHHHRDPFDRVLVAQALAEGVPVVTRDARFAAYGVAVVWDAPA